MILWKFSADKGGGSWKFILNPVNVDKPQSLRHVQPIYEFTANDSCENMYAAVFYGGSPIKCDVEDSEHRRCMLFYVTIGAELRVVLVRNTNVTHHWNNPTPLTDDVIIRKYSHPLPATPSSWKRFDYRVASVDFQKVKATWLMYDKIHNWFDGL